MVNQHQDALPILEVQVVCNFSSWRCILREVVQCTKQTPYSIDLLSGLDNNIVHSQLWLFQWSDRLDLIVQLGWNYLAFHGEHFVCDV